MLSTSQARAFYDRFGARQDKQGFYEDPALDDLIEQADFERSRAVVELGCGTGRLAARLLAGHLPDDATYRGFDLSSTMVDLARQRLGPDGRASVELSDGAMTLALPEACCDRFLSTYVADLLPEAEIRALVAEARRLLMPGGFLCLVGLTPGPGPLSGAVTAIWRLVHRLRPASVGGCRPLETLPFLNGWEIGHHRKVVAWGLASEVVVARPPAAHPAHPVS